MFAQAAGVQLLLTSPRGALLSAAAGVLLGLAYHCNAIGMRTWKVRPGRPPLMMSQLKSTLAAVSFMAHPL